MTWIFGYGSLMWRPGFTYLERRTAYLRGWSRRFYQGSTDHRGVPGAPGRVVTLVADASARCWGVAYRVPPDHELLKRLDYREKGGYRRRRVTVVAPEEPTSGAEREWSALTWLAEADNPNYLGPSTLDLIARQIVRSAGPSGRNRDYLFELARTLRAMRVDEPHVFELERQVRRLLGGGGVRRSAPETPQAERDPGEDRTT